MLFNSLDFFLFFPIVLLLYYILPFRFQNYLLLCASYFFYAYWDWRFLFLLCASTALVYYPGKLMYYANNKESKRFWFFFCIITSLGFLAIFKYYNFFVDSFGVLLSGLGLKANSLTLKIILPVGISFYTFHGLSYIIDLYNRRIDIEKNILNYALFVSFFPLLVAGPIERATHLLPQLNKPREITGEMISTGIYLIITGLFKKVVLADNLSVLVGNGFSHLNSLNMLTATLTIFAFAWQIYCDFSGYSDIARGVAKFFGIDLMLNFNLPYFSKNPSEFWKRWHISLSSWLRDYLYISLGGNRHGNFYTYRNLFLTMLLGGLWHGAAWHFIVWGAYQGFLLTSHRYITNRFSRLKIPGIINLGLCFIFTCVGWIFFRASNFNEIGQFFTAFIRINSNSFSSFFQMLYDNKLCIFIVPLLVAQIFQYWKNDNLIVFKMNPVLRPALYLLVFIITMIFGKWESNAFIYFQF